MGRSCGGTGCITVQQAKVGCKVSVGLSGVCASVGTACSIVWCAVLCCRMTTKVTQIGKYTVPAGTIVGECRELSCIVCATWCTVCSLFVLVYRFDCTDSIWVAQQSLRPVCSALVHIHGVSCSVMSYASAATPLFAIHNTQHNWEAPAQYRPERWLDVPVEAYVYDSTTNTTGGEFRVLVGLYVAVG